MAMKAGRFNGALVAGLLLSGCVAPQGVVVVQEPVGYNSWPMIQAVGDRLVCAYSRGKGHDIQEGDRGVFAKVSDDGGRTWSAETLVVNDPRVGEVTIGKGLDEQGAMLLWVRRWTHPSRKAERGHDLYRTTDGVRFEKIATPALDPVPMQITDVLHVPGVGLMCLWFSDGYHVSSVKSWGTLTSADNGRTWTQRTVETGLKEGHWPTEPSAVYLGEGRIFAIARCEAWVRHQFSLTSTDFGKTWTRANTNIADVDRSTPSLVYDPKTGHVANYYYQRGARLLKRRVASAAQVFDHPETWPEPTVLWEGDEPRPIDAGNVNVTVLDGTHYAALYTGTPTDAKVLVLPVQPQSP